MSEVPNQTDPAGDWGEPISAYTDAEALDDGILVDLSQFPLVFFLGLPVNRMTSHLFDELKPWLDADANGDAKEFGITLASILRVKTSFATHDPGNTGEVGDIYCAPPKTWFVRNEVGGWTAMYPEDY